jgi:hypothetical protein
MKKLITVLLLFGVGLMTFAQSDVVVKKVDSACNSAINIAVQAVPVVQTIAKKAAEPAQNPVEKFGGIILIALGFIGHFFVKTKWASVAQYAEVILQNVLDLVKAINSTNKGPDPKPEAKQDEPIVSETPQTPTTNA